MVNLAIIFLGTFLLVSCITFSILSNAARDTLNSTVEYLEIYGYEATVISNYAERRHIEINVTPLVAPEDKTRYEVSTSFTHTFAWINLTNKITYTATTRAVEY